MAFSLSTEVGIGEEEVAIALTHGALGSHLGIAYSEEDGSAKLMHLGWHKDFRLDAYPTQNPLWIAAIVAMPPSRSSQTVALLRMMAEDHKDPKKESTLGYGINALAGIGSIDGSATYAPSPGCDGLTCSTFIVEMLRAVGVELIQMATWPSTDRNLAWGRAIVCMLRNANVPEVHVKKVEANVSGLRIRPEEVAAAAEVPAAERPVAYADVVNRADALLAQITAQCGPPPDPTGHRIAKCVFAFNTDTKTSSLNLATSALIKAAAESGSDADLWDRVQRIASSEFATTAIWPDWRFESPKDASEKIGLIAYCAFVEGMPCFSSLTEKAFAEDQWSQTRGDRRMLLREQFVEALKHWHAIGPSVDADKQSVRAVLIRNAVAAFVGREPSLNAEAERAELAKAVGVSGEEWVNRAITDGAHLAVSRREADDELGLPPL